MLKKTIKFKDFNDVETTEDFYFNISKSEAALLEVARDGGKTLSDSLQALIESKQNAQVMAEFKDIIRLAYGVRSIDGKRFVKSKENTAEFESTGAYHELILEMISDAHAMAHFINGVLPEEMSMDPEKLVTETANHKTARQISEERMQGYNRKTQSKASKTQIVSDPETTVQEGLVVDAPSTPAPEVTLTATEDKLYDVGAMHPIEVNQPYNPAVQVEFAQDPRAEVNQTLQEQYHAAQQAQGRRAAQ